MNKNIMDYVKKYGFHPTLTPNDISSLKCPYCGTLLRYEQQGDWYWIYVCDECGKTMMTEPTYELNKSIEESQMYTARESFWLSDVYKPKSSLEVSLNGKLREIRSIVDWERNTRMKTY